MYIVTRLELKMAAFCMLFDCISAIVTYDMVRASVHFVLQACCVAAHERTYAHSAIGINEIGAVCGARKC